MSDLTAGVSADYAKIARDLNLYIKLSQPAAYATVKLIQFMMRGVKSKFFDKDITENFTKFVKSTDGNYSIFRVPFMEKSTREAAILDVKNYLDKAGVKYCILESVNDKDKAVHVSIAKPDEQKFNVMFTDYINDMLKGGEKSSEDLINLTNKRTTIISIPDSSLGIMKNALSEAGVNFAELPDLVPEDGEKQLRISSADLNTTKQCYEAYRRSIMKQNPQPDEQPETAVPEMKIYSEDDYVNTARRTADDYMESASDEIKAKISEFEQMDATEAEKEMMKWEMQIQDSKCVNCQALRSNMAYAEISIDEATLVDKNPINAQLAEKFPNHFFCTVPGTGGKETLSIPKNMVFSVSDGDRARYVAFVNKQKPAHIYDKNGLPDHEKYPTGEELFKQFDRHDNRPEFSKSKSADKAVDAAIVPKAAPVK